MFGVPPLPLFENTSEIHTVVDAAAHCVSAHTQFLLQHTRTNRDCLGEGVRSLSWSVFSCRLFNAGPLGDLPADSLQAHSTPPGPTEQVQREGVAAHLTVPLTAQAPVDFFLAFGELGGWSVCFPDEALR